MLLHWYLKRILTFIHLDWLTYILKGAAHTDKGNKDTHKGENKAKMALVEETSVKVALETEASPDVPEGKTDYPFTASNSIYTAILSRNEAVKDAKRLKNFLELRDKYVHKKVLFEDPLFPPNDSSLWYSSKFPIEFEWKRPTVSAICFPTSKGEVHLASRLERILQ